MKKVEKTGDEGESDLEERKGGLEVERWRQEVERKDREVFVDGECRDGEN